MGVYIKAGGPCRRVDLPLGRIMMKNKMLFGCLAGTVLIAKVVFSGCASTYYGQYDAKIPMKEQCLLEISDSITVLNFDGEDVKWSRFFL
jgi:hypothetical protein